MVINSTSKVALFCVSTRVRHLANEAFLGVAYQPGPDDPLINSDQCQLDAKAMQDLGANTIRVYHVDPSGNHDGCMSAFANAGIYLFVDLDTFTTQITQVCCLRKGCI